MTPPDPEPSLRVHIKPKGPARVFYGTLAVHAGALAAAGVYACGVLLKHFGLPAPALNSLTPEDLTLPRVVIALVAAVILAFPVHEGLHWIAFLKAAGVDRADIQWHPTSCNAEGERLSSRVYLTVLAAPYPPLLLTAVILLGHVATAPLGAVLIFVLPTSAIKDTLRAVKVLCTEQEFLWEDRPEELLGWLPEPTEKGEPD